MALSITSGLTEYNDCDANTGWTVGSTLDTDFMIEGIGCLGDDIDVATNHYVGPVMTAVNMSATPYTIYAYMLSFTALTLDTKVNGGLRIVLGDSAGNQSYWYVGGNDTYFGGWEVFTCNTAVAPNANNGTAADLTDIVQIGVGFKNTVKSKLPENCFWDWVRYGTNVTPALIVTGTNTTADDGWSEVLSGDDASVFGIIRAQKGSFILKGPVDFGDSVGALSLDFSDTGSAIVWDDMPVGDAAYRIRVVGNATGTTDFQLGGVVGTGDDRQGVSGNSIDTAGPLWEWDSATDIADLDSVLLYGCRFSGAGQGVGLDDDTKTIVVSMTLTNCGAFDLGATNDGAEALNIFIIDPDGVTNNYGISFPQTPSIGVLSHNAKNISFITSGVPTTQYMVDLPYAGDYSIGMAGFKFFGSFVSATLWHGINTGLNADVTINASDSDPVQSEFSSTNGGTVTVVNNVLVTLTGLKDNTEVRVLDNSTGEFLVGIESATDGTTDDRSFTFSLSAATVVDIAVFNVAFILPPNNRIENFTVPATAASIPLAQVPDRNYRNP